MATKAPTTTSAEMSAARSTKRSTKQSTKRSTTKGRHGATTRDRLLDAALELVEANGDLRAPGLRAVAKRTGLSATAVYRHFADHEALLEATADRCWGAFDAAVSSARGDDPPATLRAQGHAYVAFAADHPGLYRALFSMGEDLGDPIAERGLRSFGALVDRVAEALIERNDPRSAEQVALRLFAAIHGVADLRCTMAALPWPPVEAHIDEMLAALDLA